MMNNKVITEKILQIYKTHRKGALATVIETRGSTPAKSGFKMLVTESGPTAGTIGGGCVEAGAESIAQKVIKDGKTRIYDFELKGSSAACGGNVKVLIEPVG